MTMCDPASAISFFLMLSLFFSRSVSRYSTLRTCANNTGTEMSRTVATWITCSLCFPERRERSYRYTSSLLPMTTRSPQNTP